MTASNAYQSSWAQYCSPDDVVQGVHIGSCLADEFSAAWMEDTDAANVSSETLEQQYETVKSNTTQSPVQKFGTADFMGLPIGDFEGDLDLTVTSDSEDKIEKKLDQIVSWGKKAVKKFDRA